MLNGWPTLSCGVSLVFCLQSIFDEFTANPFDYTGTGDRTDICVLPGSSGTGGH